jgi:hypothetical protein
MERLGSGVPESVFIARRDDHGLAGTHREDCVVDPYIGLAFQHREDFLDGVQVGRGPFFGLAPLLKLTELARTCHRGNQHPGHDAAAPRLSLHALVVDHLKLRLCHVFSFPYSLGRIEILRAAQLRAEPTSRTAERGKYFAGSIDNLEGGYLWLKRLNVQNLQESHLEY